MYQAIKNNFQNKYFLYAFLFCFALSTPVFLKGIFNEYQADNLTFIKIIACTLQYLACIIVMPGIIIRKRQ